MPENVAMEEFKSYIDKLDVTELVGHGQCAEELREVQEQIYNGDVNSELMCNERNLREVFVEELIVQFYKDLFTSKGSMKEEHRDIIKRTVTARVPKQYWNKLVATPSLEEVRKDFHGMASGKSPVPNGFSVDFYKHNWGVVGGEVYKAVNFWCANISIPKYVIHEADMKIRTFLWAGKGEGSYHSKWTHSVRLKGVSVWAYKKQDRDPWYWCTILKARPLVKQKLQVSVGNGDNVFFWYDRWCALGPVWDYLDESERANLYVPLGAKLSEVEWVMPGARRQTAMLMQVHACFVQLVFSGENDKWLWGAGEFVQSRL
ncbi:hypothetical protein LIER_18504 [Lithospermum erythrorhizon]|uniref:Uncharacterized protein n=1 Tax=Lithospermum erythrorhizon TaxID=34254 RepID=A0AAV3QGT0_LITER